MKNIYPLIITSIAGFAAMLGNILLFINKKHKNKILSFSLGMSCAVMFLLSLVELIPEGLLLVYSKKNIGILIFYSLCLLIIGYILVIFIDNKIKNENNLYKVGILSAISLLIHNIPEGCVQYVSH